jgi:hypothetical protein
MLAFVMRLALLRVMGGDPAPYMPRFFDARNMRLSPCSERFSTPMRQTGGSAPTHKHNAYGPPGADETSGFRDGGVIEAAWGAGVPTLRPAPMRVASAGAGGRTAFGRR